MTLNINQSKLVWSKAAKSGADNCVEVAHLDEGAVAIRDSKQHGEGPILQYTKTEWAAFLDGAKKGEFDGFGS